MKQGDRRLRSRRPSPGPSGKRPSSQSLEHRGQGQIRRSRPRRKRWRPSPRFWMLLLMVLVFFLGGLIYLLKSDTFTISSIQIEGNLVYSEEEVAKELGNVSSNLFLFSKGKAKKKLKALEAIEEVAIEKKLPNRLIIRVQERYWLAQVEVKHETYFLDNDGVIRTDPLPKARDRKPVQLSYEGDRIEKEKELFSDQRYLDFLKSFQKGKLAQEEAKVHFEKSGGIVIMYHDMVIQFGPPNDILKKLADLDLILAEIEAKGIQAEEILLNEGKNPVVVTDHPKASSIKEKEEKKTEGEP